MSVTDKNPARVRKQADLPAQIRGSGVRRKVAEAGRSAAQGLRVSLVWAVAPHETRRDELREFGGE